MPVLFNAARHRFVFALHGSHIAHTGYLARHGVGENDLVGYLLLRVFRWLHVDGNLLIVVADAAAHRGDALSLKSREEHLLTDAVGLQALAVDVEADLLFLLSKHLHIGHRGDAA